MWVSKATRRKFQAPTDSPALPERRSPLDEAASAFASRHPALESLSRVNLACATFRVAAIYSVADFTTTRRRFVRSLGRAAVLPVIAAAGVIWIGGTSRPSPPGFRLPEFYGEDARSWQWVCGAIAAAVLFTGIEILFRKLSTIPKAAFFTWADEFLTDLAALVDELDGDVGPIIDAIAACSDPVVAERLDDRARLSFESFEAAFATLPRATLRSRPKDVAALRPAVIELRQDLRLGLNELNVRGL